MCVFGVEYRVSVFGAPVEFIVSSIVFASNMIRHLLFDVFLVGTRRATEQLMSSSNDKIQKGRKESELGIKTIPIFGKKQTFSTNNNNLSLIIAACNVSCNSTYVHNHSAFTEKRTKRSRLIPCIKLQRLSC